MATMVEPMFLAVKQAFRDGVHYVDVPGQIQAYGPVQPRAIAPAIGSRSGGTPIAITGFGLIFRLNFSYQRYWEAPRAAAAHSVSSWLTRCCVA